MSTYRNNSIFKLIVTWLSLVISYFLKIGIFLYSVSWITPIMLFLFVLLLTTRPNWLYIVKLLLLTLKCSHLSSTSSLYLFFTSLTGLTVMSFQLISPFLLHSIFFLQLDLLTFVLNFGTFIYTLLYLLNTQLRIHLLNLSFPQFFLKLYV